MHELDIFTEALDRTDPAERAAFLDQACAGNPDLRRRLEELLAGHARGGSPLDRPPVASAEADGDRRPDDPDRDAGSTGRIGRRRRSPTPIPTPPRLRTRRPPRPLS